MRLSIGRLMQEFNGNDTTTITVAKAYCTPSRLALTKILTPYHVWFDAPDFDRHAAKVGDGFPAFQTAEIVVKKKQAEWAEYLMLSSGVFRVLSKPKNAKNLEYAQRRNGLPMPWDLASGKLAHSWVEVDCSEASGATKKPGDDKKVSTVKGYGGIAYTKERKPRSRQTERRQRRKSRR